ncbi:Uma2 family endonuclease [Streptomyces reniochalinae]
MLDRPTATETPEVPEDSFQALFRTLMTMEVPDGYRAEIIGGNIVMSPWSRGYYLDVERFIDGEALTLAAELTSSSTRNADWLDKLPVYARAGVTVYLVLDMQVHTASAFWEPTPQGYAERGVAKLGEKLRLPPPFDFDLDTTGSGAVPEHRENAANLGDPEMPENQE